MDFLKLLFILSDLLWLLIGKLSVFTLIIIMNTLGFISTILYYAFCLACFFYAPHPSPPFLPLIWIGPVFFISFFNLFHFKNFKLCISIFGDNENSHVVSCGERTLDLKPKALPSHPSPTIYYLEGIEDITFLSFNVLICTWSQVCIEICWEG